MYDIIPDIHADLPRIEAILSMLGYKAGPIGWAHAGGRKAAFLGDFIDTGSNNRAVLQIVREMVAHDHAVAIMGNHELNALLYHAPSSGPEAWLRCHSEKNTGQHKSFLAEYDLGSDETRSVLDWFLTLPLFLDLGPFRMVHACWDQMAIDALLRRSPDARISQHDLTEIAGNETEFARAIDRLLKGVEIPLPEATCFYDHGGHRRAEMRAKWWRSGATTYRDAALSVPDPDQLPDDQLPADLEFAFYPSAAKPVFCGHYKLIGNPQVEVPNALCLDFPDRNCAYVWPDNATSIQTENIRIFA